MEGDGFLVIVERPTVVVAIIELNLCTDCSEKRAAEFVAPAGKSIHIQLGALNVCFDS